MAHVTFIHGIGNKTPAETLRTSWLTSLADNDGPELDAEGVSSSMIYWADFMYEAPLPVSGGAESLEAVEKDGIEDVDMGWLGEADPGGAGDGGRARGQAGGRAGRGRPG